MQRYYYSDGKEQFGPYTLEELKAKSLRPDTKVWYHGMDGWKDAQELPELQSLFKNTLYSDPTPPPIGGNSGINNPIDERVNRTTNNRINDSQNLDSVMRPYSGTRPKNWLVESILCTLFCCLPFGIVAIVYASGVDSKWSAGQYEAADQSAKMAKNWVIASFATGLAVVVIYFLLLITAGVSASRFNSNF